MAIAAVGQICATASMRANLEQCVRLVSLAADGGAKILFLPEASDYIAHDASQSLSLAQPAHTSPFVQGLQRAAHSHAVSIHVGIHEPAPPRMTATTATTGKLFNRTIYITASGEVQASASYDKMHVFDYGSLRESDTVEAGTRLTPPFDSPVGRVGSQICFDVRFGEGALALAQPTRSSPWAARPAHTVVYPSAFTVRTGRAHWETLLRARAIETQAWVVASAQVGRHDERRVSYGHSMVVDPWGRVRLHLGGVSDDDDEGQCAVGQIGFVDMDVGLVDKVRAEMPLQRRI